MRSTLAPLGLTPLFVLAQCSEPATPVCAQTRAEESAGTLLPTLHVDANGVIEAEGIVLWSSGGTDDVEGGVRAALEPWFVAALNEHPEAAEAAFVARIRADQAVDFELPKSVLKTCALDSVRVRHIQLAVLREERDAREAQFELTLPVDEYWTRPPDSLMRDGCIARPCVELCFRIRGPVGPDRSGPLDLFYQVGASQFDELSQAIDRLTKILAARGDDALHVSLQVNRPIPWGRVAHALDALAEVELEDVWFSCW